MWRKNSHRLGNGAKENQDSDQSISEEEEGSDGEWTGKTISLGGGEKNKGAVQVLSQLEILRESCELQSTEESISSHGKGGWCHVEDEVEVPIFNDRDGPRNYHRIASTTRAQANERIICLPTVASILHSDEENISDDEIQKINPNTLRSARENFGGTSSEASHGVPGLVRSNENSSCSSPHDVFVKEKKSSRGGGGRKKAKSKFVFPLHSHKKDLSLVGNDSNGRIADGIDVAADDDMDGYIAESPLNFRDKEYEQSENDVVPVELARNHDTRGRSMAEFLNSFLERNNLEQGSSGMEIQKNRRRVQAVVERNTSSSGESVVDDDDDIPEVLYSGAPFQSEVEENAQNEKSMIPRTMADQFHDAFGTVSVIDDSLHAAFPGPLCGLYRKLQQVIQSEKERDMNSLKNASAETGFKDEAKSILVRILSRSLEAKLFVCSCASVGNGKNSYWENNLETKRKGIARTSTIIFNPRMCSNVDLEVGNLIHIHPPWKEVQVKNELILLCSYFAQVQP